MKKSDPKQQKFNQIWERYSIPITLFCGGYIRSREECEDQVQEIFLKVYRNMEHYNARYSWSTWIYRIARNHCIDYLRYRGRHLEVQEGQSDFNDLSDSIRPDQPELNLIHAEEQRLVECYLKQLDLEDRQLAMLKFSESLSSRQIGKVMEMPPGTVRWRLSRIRDGLKKWMKEQS